MIIVCLICLPFLVIAIGLLLLLNTLVVGGVFC